MNNLQFDLNRGDMGRALFRPISPMEFRVLVPHIAYILKELHDSKLSPLPFKYGFEFYPPVKAEVLAYINQLERELPKNVSFYEVNSTKLFDIKGSLGGLSSGLICYLYTHD